MLIKEYRIPLPLSLEEYRIAQLYMIAKKSREESKGAGSGVEILVNEPYDDGPGGKGQYTRKIYHVGSHLPGWFKGLLPKSALTVEEMAWNAYPYTKTRYTCPFVQKFSLEIETFYCEDGGHQENVFNLSGSELRNRVVDVIDVVKDQLTGADYMVEEDPRHYVSQTTGRGPICSDNWIEEYWSDCKGKKMPLPNGKAIMSAYKLCKVEFHYWGMQSKIEKFIHDVALRKTMLRAHRQAWAWQDEWWGLTMEDIREIERQTQEALKRTMGGRDLMDPEDSGVTRDDDSSGVIPEYPSMTPQMSSSSFNTTDAGGSKEEPGGFSTNNNNNTNSSNSSVSGGARTNNNNKTTDQNGKSRQQDVGGKGGSGGGGGTRLKSCDKYLQKRYSPTPDKRSVTEKARSRGSGSNSRCSLNSPGSASNKSLEMIASWRMEGLMVNDDEGEGSDDEFFDCLDAEDQSLPNVSMVKWNSMELLGPEEDFAEPGKAETSSRRRAPRSWSQGRGPLSQDNGGSRLRRGRASSQVPDSPSIHANFAESTCSTAVLCLVMHAGSTLDSAMDLPGKKSDVTTFRGAFESVIRQHYPSMLGRVAIKLVPCPSICSQALNILSTLSPYSFDGYGLSESPKMVQESIPIGAIAVLATSQPEYAEAVHKTVTSANATYHEFLKTEMGKGFSGQIIMVGDSTGSLLAYDALARHSHHWNLTDDEGAEPSPGHLDSDHLNATSNVPNRRRSSSSTSDSGNAKLDFKVNELFMFGSPLGIVLAHRKLLSEDKQLQFPRPCNQVYNLFHPTDPLATRLEPLICSRFAGISPCNVARYSKYPLGDGQPYHLLECMQFNAHIFQENAPLNTTTTPAATAAALNSLSRRMSDISVQSGVSGHMDTFPLHYVNILTQKWWGLKRVDYALYCPEALVNFPTNALPHLFHASYWESTDAVAFILRQISHQYLSGTDGGARKENVRMFTPIRPREKWNKKRTSVKLKNLTANHRANDVIVKEGLPQTLKARFMYGPLDMVALSGEKVDIWVMRDPPHGEWSQLATDTTDKNGRIAITIPPENAFGYGIYPVKMVVRGDHTNVDFYCTVVPPKTECVVFSIDGSFTASMSVTGRDPRVRAGAVDVCRHWQELGYLIIYVTGRPDMQQHKVVSWLAQHNFPHGLVSFADGLSTDFLAHKTEYLRSLVQDHQLVIHAAYGSSKDISVYASVGIPADKIFIVGKVSKKQYSQASSLTEGYSAHLSLLVTHGGSRPAQGNARMVIPRSCFGLPGQSMPSRRRSGISCGPPILEASAEYSPLTPYYVPVLT